jgi:hypothetical protein
MQNQVVNADYENYRYLHWESYETHKYILRKIYR